MITKSLTTRHRCHLPQVGHRVVRRRARAAPGHRPQRARGALRGVPPLSDDEYQLAGAPPSRQARTASTRGMAM
jgi:hypothetical protein